MQQPMLTSADPLAGLPWSDVASKLLAYRVKALKAFNNIDYRHWTNALIAAAVRDGLITAEVAASEYGVAKKLIDALPSLRAKFSSAASHVFTGRKSLTRRLQDWYDDPERHWRRIEPVYPVLLDLVTTEFHALPDALLAHLDQFIPHAVYHALHSIMNMNGNDIFQIRDAIEGEYNIYRYSCHNRDSIAIGNCRIWYDEASKAIRTSEKYKILGQQFRLAGYLVKPDHTYRLFAKHENSNEAQVLLLSPPVLFFPKDDPGPANKAKYIEGIVVDHHARKFFYVTRIILYRIGLGAQEKQVPRDETKEIVDNIDPSIALYLRQEPRHLPYINYY
jgi:hypothetical protein